MQSYPQKLVTGIGAAPLKVLRARDQKGHQADDAILFTSQFLPPYIKRFLTRITALYEPSSGNRNVSRRSQRNPHKRDISEYHVNEPAPTEEYFKDMLMHLLAKAAQKPDIFATMGRFLYQRALLP